MEIDNDLKSQNIKIYYQHYNHSGYYEIEDLNRYALLDLVDKKLTFERKNVRIKGKVCDK